MVIACCGVCDIPLLSCLATDACCYTVVLQCKESDETKAICDNILGNRPTPAWLLSGVQMEGPLSPAELSHFMSDVEATTHALTNSGAVLYGRDGCIWYVVALVWRMLLV